MDYYLNKIRTYDNIVVGMAPKGIVVVWLSARPNLVVEIGRYQAAETDMQWKHFNPNGEQNRDVYIKNVVSRRPIVIKNLESNGIQYELYDSYRVKYNWRPIFIFPKGGSIEMNGMTMYNGEFIHQQGKLISENKFDMRALPEKMYLTWHDEKGNLFGADVDFDEEEVFKAFKAVFNEDRNQECELRFTLNEARDDFYVSLRNNTQEYELQKVDIGIFNKTKD